MINVWKPGKEIYYTNDHVWVDFRGLIAYIGITSILITNFKTIGKINFMPVFGLKNKGDIIATISDKNQIIEVLMPVEGRILEINSILMNNRYEDLLAHPEGRGWLALINPSRPYERDTLLQSEEYRKKKAC